MFVAFGMTVGCNGGHDLSSDETELIAGVFRMFVHILHNVTDVVV